MRQVQAQFLSPGARAAFDVWRQTDFEGFWDALVAGYVRTVGEYNAQHLRVGASAPAAPALPRTLLGFAVHRTAGSVSEAEQQAAEGSFPLSNQFLTEAGALLNGAGVASVQAHVAGLGFPEVRLLQQGLRDRALTAVLYDLIFLRRTFLTPVATYFSLLLFEQEAVACLTADAGLQFRVLGRLFQPLFASVSRLLLETRCLTRYAEVLCLAGALRPFCGPFAAKQLGAMEGFCARGIACEAAGLALVSRDPPPCLPTAPSAYCMAACGVLRLTGATAGVEGIAGLRAGLLGAVEAAAPTAVARLNALGLAAAMLDADDPLQSELARRVDGARAAVRQELAARTAGREAGVIGEWERRSLWE
eukprot:EST47908.1 Hypothetical protein SS50377_12012 [Spironucleus salmonicida]